MVRIIKFLFKFWSDFMVVIKSKLFVFQFSIAAINDTDSTQQWEPLAPTKEAQAPLSLSIHIHTCFSLSLSLSFPFFFLT